MKVKVTQSGLTLSDSMDCIVHGILQPEYWSAEPFPSPGHLPNPGIEPRSPTLVAGSLPAEPQGKPKNTRVGSLSLLQQICRTQESQKSYAKDLHKPGNHNGVITHIEPDILECEVKWALESITKNKASGFDGIPVEIFQILKEDAVKVLHSICQQI